MPISYHKWLFRSREYDIKAANWDIIQMRCKINQKSENTELLIQEDDPFMKDWLNKTTIIYNENCRLIQEIEKIYSPIDEMTTDQIENHWKQHYLTINQFQDNQKMLFELFEDCLKFLNKKENEQDQKDSNDE